MEVRGVLEENLAYVDAAIISLEKLMGESRKRARTLFPMGGPTEISSAARL